MPKTRWNFTAEITTDLIIEAQVRGYSDPGIRTLRNGDPGYPPERDEEREITGARFELLTGWDHSDPAHPKAIRRQIKLDSEQLAAMRPILEEIVDLEDINPADYEQEPVDHSDDPCPCGDPDCSRTFGHPEEYDCPIHGPQETADCPRC